MAKRSRSPSDTAATNPGRSNPTFRRVVHTSSNQSSVIIRHRIGSRRNRIGSLRHWQSQSTRTEPEPSSTPEMFPEPHNSDGHPAPPPSPVRVDSAPIPSHRRKHGVIGKLPHMRKDTTSAKLREYLELRDEALDELIRLEGLGDYLNDRVCFDCGKADGIIRCKNCSSLALSCVACTIDRHGLLPLHQVERWNGDSFQRTTLTDLGLRVQLGHGPDSPCSDIQVGLRMTVFDITGIHTVHVDYCHCERNRSVPRRWQLLRNRWFPATFDRPQTVFTFRFLDHFHELNLQGKITLYDYYQATSHLADNWELGQQVYRRPEFHRTMRIWRQLQMLKRAGRAHDPSGIQATKQGQLCVECPACPHPGQNLPTEWESAKDDAWLYTLFLAIDANFKLKSKSRGLEDVELDPGWSFFVGTGPYKEHLKQYSDQPEINTCRNEHDAILRANTRHTAGYDVSGVVLVICARHAFVQGNGAGDLEKGERYCSVDYIVFSALVAFQLKLLVLSYDIACQWSKNLIKRSAEYPPELRPDPSRTKITCVIPRWHAEGHDQFCQTRFSFNYTPGVGKTCGEDIESTWSVSNQMSASVREMAPSARHEALNDHWNGWNFRKMINLRASLLKRLKDAYVNSSRQKDIFARFTATFSAPTVLKWEKMVQTWEKDKSGKCPYEEAQSVLSVHDVQLQLAKEEAEATTAGHIGAHRTSLSKFLLDGLNLEEKQRAFIRDLSKEKKTAKELAEIENKRASLRHDIMIWRSIQVAYMPCIVPLIAASAFASPTDGGTDGPAPAEVVPLYLPSTIPRDLSAFVQDVADKELKYRLAQADDCLNAIRKQRRIIHSVYVFKKLNVSGTGNKPNTRVRSVFDKINKRIKSLAAKYRVAREALLVLNPGGAWMARFLPLLDADIRGPGRESDDAPNSSFVPSWIWLAASSTTNASCPAPSNQMFTNPQDLRPNNAAATPAPLHLTDPLPSPHNDSGDDSMAGLPVSNESQEPEFDETMRIEWAKTKARAARWEEELVLVQEEMRRSLEFLAWKVKWWRNQGTRRANATPAVRSGLLVYASKQADFFEALVQASVNTWLPALQARGLSPLWTAKYTAAPKAQKQKKKRNVAITITALSEEGTPIASIPSVPLSPTANAQPSSSSTSRTTLTVDESLSSDSDSEIEADEVIDDQVEEEQENYATDNSYDAYMDSDSDMN